MNLRSTVLIALLAASGCTTTGTVADRERWGPSAETVRRIALADRQCRYVVPLGSRLQKLDCGPRTDSNAQARAAQEQLRGWIGLGPKS